jgi:gliding motility-associated-like protein
MYKLVKVIAWLFMYGCVAGAGAHAQTPGGISSGLTSWFKANSPVPGNVDTAGSTTVANWKSELGNFQVSQTTASRQPVFQATNTQTGNFNFNPFVQFSKAGNTVLCNTAVTPDLTGTNGSVFIVINTYNSEADGNPSGFTYKATNYAFQFKPGFRIQTGDGTAGGTGDYYNWLPWPSGAPNYAPSSGIILTGKGVDQSTATSNFSPRRNGDSLAVTHRYNQPADGYSYTPIIPSGLFMGSDQAGTGGQNMSCGLAEVITYNSYLPEADENKVETYLAIKYGITLTRGMSAVNRNYTASDGTNIWDAAANAGYPYNITGIGRDDNSGLFQKQSKSVHNNALVYLYNGTTSGTFPASNAANTSAIDDKSFLLFGDNGLSKNMTYCVGTRARMERTWKVQKTGTGMLTVTLAVDKDSVAAMVKGVVVSTSPLFSPGTYTFYPFTLANGKLYAEVTLGNNTWFSFATNDSLKIATTAAAPVCTDSLSGKVTTSVSGGIEPYSYVWSTGANTEVLTGVKPGTYTVTISDMCQSVTTSAVVLPPTAPAAPTATGARICLGDTADLYVQNPNAAYTYNWYNTATAGTVQRSGTSYSVVPAALPATYYVGLQYGNCSSSRTPVLVSQAAQLTKPVVTATNITPYTVTFQWLPVPNATGYLVSINGGIYIAPTSGNLGLTHVITALQPTETITITVIALGVSSCQNSSNNATAITLADEIFIPNSFTPNGDGKNDVFKVYGNVLAGMEMNIFNQWGQLIYAGKDLSAGWDGTQQGRLQPIGVYFYAIRLRLNDGSEQVRKGSVNLLR